MEHITDPREPAGVHRVQRIVHHITVAVEILAVFRHLNIRVRAEETPDLRIVDPPVHVDQAAVIELLVTGVATVIILRGGPERIAVRGTEIRPRGGIATLTPWIERLVLDLRIGEGRGARIPRAGVEHRGGTEMVLEHGGQLDRGDISARRRDDFFRINSDAAQGVTMDRLGNRG